MSVLKRPILTEKTTFYTERLNLPKYGFRVELCATKAEIKKEVETMYDVKVANVNTMIVNGKAKTRQSKRGIVRGRTSTFKKAIVTLKDGFEIDFYKHI